MSQADTHIVATASLPVMEHFYTIQGEGYHQGRPAYFIRLGGCDVGCVWCDVKDSWDASRHPLYTIQQLADTVSAVPGDIVVITGGEPLMHNLTELTQQLHTAGKRLHIETSGAHAISGSWDWVCLSPKKFKAPVDTIYPYADELKVVIFNKHDFAWAEEHAARVKKECLLYLQPEWSKEQEMLPLIIDYVKQHPQWRISLQVHKYMQIP